jgi:hypothetical protein
MRVRIFGPTKKVENWAKNANGHQIDKIDKKTSAAKDKLNLAKRNILLNVGEYTLQVVTAAQGEDACERCCFALLGKSTANCPTVDYGGDRFHMCTIYGKGRRDYFVETSYDKKALFSERRIN